MNHFFAYINRMRFIQRWSLMRNSYTENIQEHSHQTAVLAHALAVLRNERFGGQVDVGAVAVAALYHDAGEILTGDMPTPVKYKNESIKTAYKAVEKEAQSALLSRLPVPMAEEMAPWFTPTEEYRPFIKAADTRQNASFAIRLPHGAQELPQEQDAEDDIPDEAEVGADAEDESVWSPDGRKEAGR